MLSASALPRPEDFSVLDQQLEKIFSDPLFSEAGILKKFLKFIVQETYHGRSNCLKEYTIATNVLGKPANFRPQENGIVRIHAGRLRRALDLYYDTSGSNDELVIFVPKGKYVPEFSIKERDASNGQLEYLYPEGSVEVREKRTLAVAPFLFDENDRVTRAFTDGLCMQLSSNLMDLKDVSLISYQTIRGMTNGLKDLRELHRSVGCGYLISGGIQCVNHQARITCQLFQTESGQQLWSAVFERTLTKTNMLKVQDELVKEMNVAISKALTWIAKDAKTTLVN